MLDYAKAKFLETWQEEEKEVTIIFEFSKNETQNIVSGDYKDLYNEEMKNFRNLLGDSFAELPPCVELNLAYYDDDLGKQYLDLLFGVKINGHSEIFFSQRLSPYVDYSATDVISLLKIAFSATNA